MAVNPTTGYTREKAAALAVYADHPAHCKVKEFVHSVICDRVCCDYEV